MEETEKKQDEVEISLVELAEELKRCWRAVVAVAVVCGAAAAVYAYATLAPVYYVYDARLQLPLNTGAWQINTCCEVLRGDQGVVPGLNGVWQQENSHVLIVRFTGADGSVVKAQAQKYLPQAKEKADTLLLGQQRADFERTTLNELRRDMAALALNGGAEAAGRLAELQNIVEAKADQAKLFPAVQVIAPPAPRRIEPPLNLGSNIFFAALGGLILSCGYVIVRYVYKKAAAV